MLATAIRRAVKDTGALADFAAEFMPLLEETARETSLNASYRRYFLRRYASHLAGIRAELLQSFPHGGRAVDIGCGAGQWCAAYQSLSLDHEIIGVDRNAALIGAVLAALARSTFTLDVQFVCASANETGLPSGVFDAVLCANALNYIEPHAALREMARLLKPDGLIHLSALTDFSLYTQIVRSLRFADLANIRKIGVQYGHASGPRHGLSPVPGYAWFYTPNDIAWLAASVGFQIAQRFPCADDYGSFAGSPCAVTYVLKRGTMRVEHPDPPVYPAIGEALAARDFDRALSVSTVLPGHDARAGLLLYYAGRFDELGALDPPSAHDAALVAFAHAELGGFDDCTEAVRKMITLFAREQGAAESDMAAALAEAQPPPIRR
jgi:SAM-dependent methyltransferase